MPCRYDGPYEDGSRHELDKVTRLLCSVMQHVDSKLIDKTEYSTELKAWWSQHKKADEARLKKELEEKEKEKDKKKALKKLSPYEKKLLNISDDE